MVHIDLIGPYIKSIIKQQPGNAIIRKNSSMTCMAMIVPATGWFEIVEIPTFNFNDLMSGND